VKKKIKENFKFWFDFAENAPKMQPQFAEKKTKNC